MAADEQTNSEIASFVDLLTLTRLRDLREDRRLSIKLVFPELTVQLDQVAQSPSHFMAASSLASPRTSDIFPKSFATFSLHSANRCPCRHGLQPA